MIQSIIVCCMCTLAAAGVWFAIVTEPRRAG